MIYWFLDACALARYYFEDLGSDLVKQIFALGETTRIIYNILAIAETVSVFTRVRNTGIFDEDKRLELISEFEEDLETQQLILMLKMEEAQEAIKLVRRYDLRGSDSIHLASASIFKRRLLHADDRLILVTSDSQLCNSALSEGMECLHLWSCKCNGCGAIFIANKSKGGQCDSCRRTYSVDDLNGLSRDVKVLEIIG